MWPAIDNFVGELEKLPKSKKPTSKAYFTILKAVEDPTTLAKMHAFVAEVKDLEEFLNVFQSDKPMLPMLHQFLHEMIHTLLGKIVHQKKLDGLSLNDMLSLD